MVMVIFKQNLLSMNIQCTIWEVHLPLRRMLCAM
uniref:Uncharacterized protein n=1 Tax=Arundo donax TaxID=35708 RepID=A0A0A9G7T2_ARUDO